MVQLYFRFRINLSYVLRTCSFHNMHYILFCYFKGNFIFVTISVFSSGIDNENDVWIGMKYDITSTPHVYRWINCEKPTLMIWTHGEPNFQLIDLCIRMSKDFSFQLRTTVCTTALNYLCTGRTIKTMCFFFNCIWLFQLLNWSVLIVNKHTDFRRN